MSNTSAPTVADRRRLVGLTTLAVGVLAAFAAHSPAAGAEAPAIPPTEPPVIVNPTVPESTDAPEPTNPGDLDNPEFPETTDAPEPTNPGDLDNPEFPETTEAPTPETTEAPVLEDPPQQPVPDGPRFTVGADVDCATQTVTFSYDDHVDGHVPQSVDDWVGSGGTGNFFQAFGGVHQVNGHYTNSHTLPTAGPNIPDTHFYEYIVTISYEDGVEQMDGVTLHLDDVCPVAAAGTLPETGANDTTWVIATIGALLLGAGAAFTVGSRRSNPAS